LRLVVNFDTELGQLEQALLQLVGCSVEVERGENLDPRTDNTGSSQHC
jgi:hypothetical protein